MGASSRAPLVGGEVAAGSHDAAQAQVDQGGAGVLDGAFAQSGQPGDGGVGCGHPSAGGMVCCGSVGTGHGHEGAPGDPHRSSHRVPAARSASRAVRTMWHIAMTSFWAWGKRAISMV